jgi:CBS domain-containing protein
MNLVKRLLDQKGRGAVTVGPEVSLATCAKRMADRRVGSLVVGERAEIKGVRTLCNLARAMGPCPGGANGLEPLSQRVPHLRNEPLKPIPDRP